MKDHKYVYILTKEGRAFNEDGIQYLMECLRNTIKETADRISICEGQMYNKPAFLIQNLEQRPDSYVAISSNQGLDIISKANIQVLIHNLKENPDKTSWETAIAPYNYPDL